MKLFTRPGDYEAFLRLLREAHVKYPDVRILGYCIMPNHWHLVLYPTRDGELSRMMFWLTMTHALRWRFARKLVGLGPLYQGRFKSFPVEDDEHLFTVLRYTERNPLRAELVERAELWQWSSLYLRMNDPATASELLSPWPIEMPADWLQWVNKPQTEKEVQEMRRHIRTGIPYGNPPWQKHTARRLGIELDPKPRGRPRGK
jgi:putative transposase